MRLIQLGIWAGVIAATGLMTRLVVVSAQTPLPAPATDLGYCTVPGMCVQLGLTPESLVMAGVSAGEVQAIMAALQEAYELRLQLAELAESADSLNQTITQLSETLFVDPTLESAIDSFETATAQLDVVRSQMTQARSQLFEIATAALTTGQRQALTTCHDGADKRVPAEFRAVQRTEEQWAAIEQALIAEAQASQLDAPVPSEAATLLAQVRNDPPVVSAQQALAAGLEVMQGQFDALVPQYSSDV